MSQSKSIAISIIVGSALVAVSFFITNGNMINGDGSLGPTRDSKTRALYGEPKAPVTIVEFCSVLHPVLKRLVDESNGEINWEYRHLPLPSHRSAEFAALVAECVLVKEGNEAFWDFADEAFQKQKTFSEITISEMGKNAGLSQIDIDACKENSEIQNQIALDSVTAAQFGGRGTPFSVIVFSDGSTKPVSGALPYSNWKSLLNL